jgi:Ca2+-binding EF-hand superfamily protein
MTGSVRDYNEVAELLDFDLSDSAQVVSCHLTHEGLYFKLNPGTTEGLSEEELARGMMSLRIPAASAIARATLKAADKDNNGTISMDEFLAFLAEREKELLETFRALDFDKDGYITYTDLLNARESGLLEASASDDELLEIVSWMDTLEDAYHDQKIHFEEFRTAMILLPSSMGLNDMIKHRRVTISKEQNELNIQGVEPLVRQRF